MMSRKEMLKVGSLASVASLVSFTDTFSQKMREKSKNSRPLKITKVEPIIIRIPNDNVPSDELIEMPPMGAMRDRAGIGKRLDHASPSRFKGHLQTLLIKIYTDQGIVGWGESHAVAAPRAHHRVVTDLLNPILQGEDAKRILPLWEKMYSSQRMRGYATGFYTEAIAGADMALWDILGKYLEVPVYELLGGKFRDKIPTYARAGTPEETKRKIEEGFPAVKTGFNKGTSSDDINRITALSEAVGKEGQVFVDSLGAFKLHEAIQVGRKFDELGNIGWFEDALLPEETSRYPKLAEALDTAVCVGETYSNRFQFRDLFTQQGADIINPDLGRAAGITECKRIADLADIFGVLWSPHISSGFPPYVAASIHLAVATPNAVIIEGGDLHNATSVRGSKGNMLLKDPIEFGPGFAVVPESSGLGIEFDENELKKFIVTDI